MVLLCFVMDLCGLSPPLLEDLKQCLLQLANFYAISSPSSQHHHYRSESLRDRIGLCYTLKNGSSCSDELKVAYSPRGDFSLRDFHHAVNDLPVDAFLPQINDSGAPCSRDVKISSVLSDQVLYSWGGKDIMRKVVVLSSCLPERIDSVTKKILMDAAEKCISVEFILFEQSSSHLSNMQDNVNYFLRSLTDLDNYSFQTCLPDSRVFNSLVKRWLMDLKDDMEEPMQARFIFKSNLVGSVNQLHCSLSITVCQIINGFSACKTCRCHGTLLDNTVKDKAEGHSCQVTGHDLGRSDVVENSVKVGDKTILFMPSFHSRMSLQPISSPIDFNVIERTNLRSLSEGVISGSSYFVTPSTYHEVETSSNELDQSELNAQLFQGICCALHSMDQGLVCSSYCNVETMREAAFQCYYILHPSDNGPMLLRRLAGAEEVLPMPDVNRFIDSSATKGIEDSVQASLLNIELRDYNPILHERGFHQKLNLLVKESLQFGSIASELNEVTSSKLNSKEPDSFEVTVHSDSVIDVVDDETLQSNVTAQADNITVSIAEEWEQLVVNKSFKIHSPTFISKPKMDLPVLSPPNGNKQLDIKTSRILERLEAPRQLKTKAVSPTLTNSSYSGTCTTTKKPLIPFQPANCTNQSLTSSQLMKPNFQRLKRKHK